MRAPLLGSSRGLIRRRPSSALTRLLAFFIPSVSAVARLATTTKLQDDCAQVDIGTKDVDDMDLIADQCTTATSTINHVDCSIVGHSGLYTITEEFHYDGSSKYMNECWAGERVPRYTIYGQKVSF
ncbi:hypothetical protein DFS33DRAFT_1277000 [Desarmillaria ectypa]|nr:hypothetical protein DFS33DRAFT_1277000 [Desarmillaria ectypa]